MFDIRQSFFSTALSKLGGYYEITIACLTRSLQLPSRTGIPRIGAMVYISLKGFGWSIARL
jgi:hypothetical protein